MLRERDEWLPAGWHMDVAVDTGLAEVATIPPGAMAHADLTVHPGDGGPDSLIALADGAPPDQVIVLGYRDSLSADDADARTLLTLLTLRTVWPATHTPRVRIVAEPPDQQNLALAGPAGLDEPLRSAAPARPQSRRESSSSRSASRRSRAMRMIDISSWCQSGSEGSGRTTER